MLNKNGSIKYMLLLILSVSLFLNARSNNTSSQSYTLVDQMEAAKIAEDNEIERIKLEKKEEFDKMYANEIYLEDFNEIKSAFYQDYSSYIEGILSKSDMPYVYELEVQFYNTSLMKGKSGDLKFEEIRLKPGEHIRKIDLKISFFRDSSDALKKELQPIYNTLKTYWDENNTTGVVKNEILWSVYSKKVLDQIDMRDICNNSNHIVLLEPYKKCLSRNIFSTNGLDSYALGLDTTQEELNHLAEEAHKKYKEEFIGIIDLKSKGPSMCAPINDISLAFETDGEGADKYITLLVQKAIQEMVSEVLVEVGLEDVVVPIVVPKDRGTPENLKQRVDYPQKIPNETLVNKNFFTGIDITLYYLIDNIDEVDYEKLYDFYLLMDLFLVIQNNDNIKVKNSNYFVYYFIDENSGVRNIHKENILCSELTTKYLSNHIDINNLAMSLYVTDDKSEISQLIKAYTKKEDQISDFSALRAFDEEIGIEKFIKYTIVDNIYGY